MAAWQFFNSRCLPDACETAGMELINISRRFQAKLRHMQSVSLVITVDAAIAMPELKPGMITFCRQTGNKCTSVVRLWAKLVMPAKDNYRLSERICALARRNR